MKLVQEINLKVKWLSTSQKRLMSSDKAKLRLIDESSWLTNFDFGHIYLLWKLFLCQKTKDNIQFLGILCWVRWRGGWIHLHEANCGDFEGPQSGYWS